MHVKKTQEIISVSLGSLFKNKILARLDFFAFLLPEHSIIIFRDSGLSVLLLYSSVGIACISTGTFCLFLKSSVV